MAIAMISSKSLDSEIHAQLQTLAWPAARLSEAIEVLARKAGFVSTPVEITAPPHYLSQLNGQMLDQWVEAVAAQLKIEAEPAASSYAEIEQFIRDATPALLRLPDIFEDGQTYFLTLLKRSWGRILVIGPDFKVCPVDPQVIRTALCHEVESPLVAEIDEMLAEAGIDVDRRRHVRDAILRERLSPLRIEVGWLLRLAPGANLWQQVYHARLFRPLSTLLGAYLIQQLLLIISWWVIGRSIFSGHFEKAWLLAWGLVLFTAIPFQLLMAYAQSRLALGTSGLFKQRLLFGTLQLEPEEIRHQGSGQFLGRVMEAETVESLVLSGGFAAIMALLQVGVAALVLSTGTAGWLYLSLLLGWTLFTLLQGWRYFRQNRLFIEAYRAMTNDLVEGMVGHQTRLAQEDRRQWHEEEDRALTRYFKSVQQADQIAVQMNSLAPRGWLVIGLVCLAYLLIFTPISVAELAVKLGGVILAFQALSSLIGGVQSVVGVVVAWDQVGPLFRAATRPTQELNLEYLAEAAANSPQSGEPIMTARDLMFRYRDHGQPVLQGCDLQVRQGDRLLLEGPSGGGKSTLAALLAGLRQATSGLLLWRGIDQKTMGLAEWRRRVVTAPQFHENHVLTGTFAFNLLLGRRWPASPEDLQEAEIICRELGLGALLERMPAGLQQMVGESGWQLSHGERSRLYIARALLQKADLIILDESFAALDPENLQYALSCVLNRAPTLLVIAHP